MKGLVVLVVLVGVWSALASLLRRKGWTAVRRHMVAGLCGFFAMILVTGVMMDPSDRKPSVTAAGSTKGSGVEAPAADTASADRKAMYTKIQELDGSIVAVDHMDYATPPKLVITLKPSGWDDKRTFYSFVGAASRIVTKTTEMQLVDSGVDFVFIFRAVVTSFDGDGGKSSSEENILQILVPAADVPTILADKDRPAASALLRHAQVQFNGRIGHDMVSDFCTAEQFQGRTGLAPSKTFCRSLLQ